VKFTQTHEWVRVENGIATVGVTDFAQNELGEIVYVELPKIGSHVKKSQEAVVLESTKAAVDVYSPISGEVIEVNEALRTQADLINASAFDKGWLFKIKPLNQSEFLIEFDELLDTDAALA